MSSLRPDQAVRHSVHGEGRVVADLGATIVARFGAQLHQVEARDLIPVRSLSDTLASGRLDNSLGLLARAQAHLVGSVNEQWGVFSRSRVTLLPHQLWVCRQVTRTWPTRWLVADDVGLGKTIEAGLILEPLMSAGRVRRVLVLAPARLVPQWRSRLKNMFDIRLQEYSVEQDKGRLSFWETASQVVASFHTLRQEKALRRLLEAEPWDMVMVDEAHHFQAQERASTLTYSLLRQLEVMGRIRSLVLFTGTPHRGKDYGFLALMQLVRPDLFDPARDTAEQLPNLQHAMIRNNKALVTDLQGKKLFRPVTTRTIDYEYSPAEAHFYETMSAFIVDGRAYAMSLSGRQQTARMLLLIALQKLAASSIAAIRRALDRRRTMLQQQLEEQVLVGTPDSEPDTLDDAAELEESRPAELGLLLMRNEIARLDDLINLADQIGQESKIARLLSLIGEHIEVDEPLLIFTEYKATQALIYSALEERFGAGSVGFINGDERLVLSSSESRERTITLKREVAASDFNAGRTRFLISTEAGGEGIDLQETCAMLVHADLPWNPMRLHQRVGRIHRYGQKRPVSVYLLRNPQTVEARIWALLEEKLSRIQSALSATMEEAEDITQLVIGMSGNRFFDELFAGGTSTQIERLSSWFDSQTQQFGGQDAVDMVRQLLGNVARYDFQAVGADVPRLDLPALEPFFRNAMQHFGRRVRRSGNGLSVATPEDWKSSLDFRSRYDELVFDRQLPQDQALLRLLGVGHPLIDRSLAELRKEDHFVGRVRGLTGALVLVNVEDEVTGTEATVHRIVVGAKITEEGAKTMLKDWEALLRLNDLEALTTEVPPPSPSELTRVRELIEWVPSQPLLEALPFRRPKITAAIAMLPEASLP